MIRIGVFVYSLPSWPSRDPQTIRALFVAPSSPISSSHKAVASCRDTRCIHLKIGNHLLHAMQQLGLR